MQVGGEERQVGGAGAAAPPRLLNRSRSKLRLQQMHAPRSVCSIGAAQNGRLQQMNALGSKKSVQEGTRTLASEETRTSTVHLNRSVTWTEIKWKIRTLEGPRDFFGANSIYSVKKVEALEEV